MKKWFAFILLLLHINFSMFIAQLDEVDVYDHSGKQLEDVNSLAQYVAQVFHFHHKPVKDSDDDNARYFHLEKINYSVNGLLFVEFCKPSYEPVAALNYPPFLQKKVHAGFIDRIYPPPRA